MTFQNKLLQQNRYPRSLLFQSKTQVRAIHYYLLSRVAELYNEVQRHFVVTVRLLLHSSISRTASKTPTFYLFISGNQPTDGTVDFHSRCLGSKFLVCLKPFSTFSMYLRVSQYRLRIPEEAKNPPFCTNLPDQL